MRGEKGWYNQLLEMLPEGWEAKAKELGAMQRTRVSGRAVRWTNPTPSYIWTRCGSGAVWTGKAA